jgi:hypothetical protein
MRGRIVSVTSMRVKKPNRKGKVGIPCRLRLHGLILASMALAFSLAACESVATYTQPAAVRVIDASYIAPAANFSVEKQLLAANVGSGTITPYGTLPPNAAAAIEMTMASGGAELLTASASLQPGNQYSIFLADSVGTSTAYLITVLQDQQIQAPAGRSAFRFLNQAESMGAIDIYMVPAGTAIADAVPLLTDLPVGGPAVYVNFDSQTVTMIIAPTGVTTPAYISNPIQLTGGEARTALIMDSKLTSNPAVTVTMADDSGPAN